MFLLSFFKNNLFFYIISVHCLFQHHPHLQKRKASANIFPWKRELRSVSISLSTLPFPYRIELQTLKPHSLFHILLLVLILLPFTVSSAQSPNAISWLIGPHKTTTSFAPSQSTLEPPLSLLSSSIAPSPA